MAYPHTATFHRWTKLALGAIGCAALAACGGGSSSTGTGSGGGGTGTGGSGTGGADACAALCETEATLACPNTTKDGCTAQCELSKTAVSWCTAIATTATDCLSKQPATSFECDMNGAVGPKAGVCGAALTAMQSCWYQGPPGGLPDLGQACSDVCAKQASLPCAGASCTDNCNGGLTPGQKCTGAFAALVACAAKQDAASFACDAQTNAPALKQDVCTFEQVLLYGCLQQP